MNHSIIGPSIFDTFKLKETLLLNDAGEWGHEPDNNAIGVLRSTNFSNQGYLLTEDIAYRTLSELKKNDKMLKIGDIIIERSGGSNTQPVGRVGFIDKSINEKGFAFANFIQRIRVDEEIFDPKFVYYCLQQMYEMGVTSSMQFQTTGIRNLDYKYYLKSKLPRPLVDEQKIIAEILFKVDEAIASVGFCIKASEILKKSLMQNLLTGKLKPDGTWRGENEFYDDEKIGKYPKEWNASRFKEFAVLQRGRDLTDSGIISGPYPVVKSNGVQIYHNDFFVEPPGVVTGRSGTIGKAFYIIDKFWAHNTTLYVKDFKGNCAKFIYYLILRMDFRQYYAGTTVPTLNRNDIHRLRIAIPKTYEEQESIANKIDEIDLVLREKHAKIQSLKTLKKSLMQNLLTGKNRVDVDKINKILEEGGNG